MASGSGAAAQVTGSSYAVLINVPGAQSSGTLTSPSGSYQYRDLVSIHAYDAGSALSGERAYAHADLTGISLLGGLVTADAAAARTFADGRKQQASGTFGGSVTNLVVEGAAVSVQPGGQFAIPGVGFGAVDERRVVHSVARTAAPRSRSTSTSRPDGTTCRPAPRSCSATRRAVAAGQAATATQAPGAPGAPAAAAAGDRGGESTTDPSQLDAPVVPIPASDGTPTDFGDGITPTGY